MKKAKVIDLEGHVTQRGAEDLSRELLEDLSALIPAAIPLIGAGPKARGQAQSMVQKMREQVRELEVQLMIIEAFETNRFRRVTDASGKSEIVIDEALMVERLAHDD